MINHAPTFIALGEPILIVDDEKNIRRTLRMVLEGEGHVVHEAGSIAEAEVVLARDPIDLILLDVKLGEDNGLDLLRTLKSRGDDGLSPVTSEIPVVMISGHATIEDAVAATRLGAFDFMEKPLDRHRPQQLSGAEPLEGNLSRERDVPARIQPCSEQSIAAGEAVQDTRDARVSCDQCSGVLIGLKPLFEEGTSHSVRQVDGDL